MPPPPLPLFLSLTHTCRSPQHRHKRGSLSLNRVSRSPSPPLALPHTNWQLVSHCSSSSTVAIRSRVCDMTRHIHVYHCMYIHLSLFCTCNTTHELPSVAIRSRVCDVTRHIHVCIYACITCIFIHVYPFCTCDTTHELPTVAIRSRVCDTTRHIHVYPFALATLPTNYLRSIRSCVCGMSSSYTRVSLLHLRY